MKHYELPQRLATAAMNDAYKEITAQHKKGIFSEGNPNHPMYNNGWNYATVQFVSLFGYSQDTLLAKQY